MQMSHRGSGPVARAYPASLEPAFWDRSLRHRRARRLPRFLVGTLLAASVCISAVQAATLGHSRIVSSSGQPLHLEIQVTELTPQEVETLRVTPAPGDDWRAAGMTPPVPLHSMRLLLLDGYRPDVKVIQLRSDRVFDDAIVDVLLDVRSVSGQQRYQVSLVAHADTNNIQRASIDARRNPRAVDGLGPFAQTTGHAAFGRQITVRSRDNMFAVARRNAVEGVTVYQMMIALQRSNPRAFIEDNVNLVRAGATLTMPDMDVLTALSDREARRIFQQHAQAFALYRQRGLAGEVATASTVLEAAQGEVVESATTLGQPEGAAGPSNAGDRLRLSGASSERSNAASSQTAGGGSARGGANDGGAAVSFGGVGFNNGLAANGSSGTGGSNGISELGQLNGLNGGTSDAAHKPPVSLLASSGAIASDAVVHEAPDALSGDLPGSARFGSDASSGGTILAAGALDYDPDDEAARKKRIEESKKRILELEDNVRHLNEALQTQGHVAAEAALEGARSVTEVIKEVMSLVDPDDETGEGASSSAAGGEAPAGGDISDSGAATREGRSAAAGDAAESAKAAAVGTNAAGKPSVEARSNAAVGRSSETAGASGSANVGSNAGAAALTSSGQGATGSAAQKAASSAATVEDGSEGQAPKVEKTDSWFKENMLTVLGGGLALIVLIAVWLLRRASAAREEDYGEHSPISDSMVQEKLREIDLDLNQPPRGGRRS